MLKYRILLRVFGLLAAVVSIGMIMPLIATFIYDEDPYPFIISIISSAVFATLAFLGSKKKEELRAKEGFAIVGFGWVFMALIGSLPYYISGCIPDFTNAFFESISGYTTTGATILQDIEVLPKSMLLWRSTTHWIGGMGIIVLSIAILPFLGVGGMQLFKAETPGPIADKLTPRITETAKILWIVYLVFTLAEIILLYAFGMDLFDALNHSFATLATGGFSTKNASIAHYDSPYIHYIVMFFMLLAGTSFSLHYLVFTKGFGVIKQNKEFLFFLSIIFAATLLMAFAEYGSNYDNIEQSFRVTLFQSLSIITTTGFGLEDYEKWTTSSQMIIFGLMFFGGCAGSTSGGIKIIRLFILLKFSFKEITRLLHPNAISLIRMGDSVIDKKIVLNVAGFFVTYVFLTVVSSVLLSFMGLDYTTALSAAATSISNVGPGLGTIGPTENYAHLPDLAKWLLSFLMLLGRLEIFTVLVLLTPNFWRT